MKINLLPWRSQLRYQKRIYFYTSLTAILVAISLAVLTWNSLTIKKLKQVDFQNNLLRKQINQNNHSKTFTSVSSEYNRLMRIHHLRLINKQCWKTIMQYLNTISQNTAKKIILKSIIIQKKGINLRGSSINIAGLVTYFKQLRDSAFFKEIVLLKLKQRDFIEFQINLEIYRKSRCLQNLSSSSIAI